MSHPRRRGTSTAPGRPSRDARLDVELTLVPDAGHLDTALGFLASLERARAESVAWVLAALCDS